MGVFECAAFFHCQSNQGNPNLIPSSPRWRPELRSPFDRTTDSAAGLSADYALGLVTYASRRISES